MLGPLTDFIGELRTVGIPVSVTEVMDAARAVEIIDLGNRDILRQSLSASLVKHAEHLDAFNSAFDVYFSRHALDPAMSPSGGGPGSNAATTTTPQRGGGANLSHTELTEAMLRALASNDDQMLHQVAAEAVARFGNVESGRPVGVNYYFQRTLRHLNLGDLEQQLRESLLAHQAEGTLSERLADDESRYRIEKLTNEIDQIIRELLIKDRGVAAVAESTRQVLPEDVDVMHATREEIAQLEKALRPLSRKLAARLAQRRRRRRHGPVDIRHTMRSSLSTGGVPIDLRFRPPHPSKPEIFVIADISGSVASFARFTLHLVHAISSEFSKVRSFVFVDGLDEVTRFFEGVEEPAAAVARIQSEANVIVADGHSDYGRALSLFLATYGHDVTSRSTVLILGDARNNYHPPAAHQLAELRRRSRNLYWLNPEPKSYWNSGDSIVASYEPHCTKVIECRTLRQLEAFVGELA